MIRKFEWMLAILAALSPTAAAQQTSCPEIGNKPGLTSKLAVYLCFQDEDSKIRHLEIPSPDGSVLLVVDGNEAKFTENGRVISGPFLVVDDADIIWSPDSRAIILDFSLGGQGPGRAGVIYVRQEVADVPDITELIVNDFVSRHPGNLCSDAANITGLSWVNGSNSAVFIAQEPSSSSCGSLIGYFEAYIVSIPEGNILARYSQRETVRRWRKTLISEMLEDK